MGNFHAYTANQKGPKMALKGVKMPLGIVLVILFLYNSMLYSSDYFVYIDADAGPGSFREALTEAEDGDRIMFDEGLDGATLFLESPLSMIDKKLTLIGPSPNGVHLVGNNQFPVFIFESVKVRMQHLHISHGFGSTDKEEEYFGGGVSIDKGSVVRMEDVSFEGNLVVNKGECNEAGAAIIVQGGGRLSLCASHFANNAVLEDLAPARFQDICVMEEGTLDLFVGDGDKVGDLILEGAGQWNKEGSGLLMLNPETCRRFKGTLMLTEGILEIGHETECTIKVGQEATLRGSGSVGSVANKGLVQPGWGAGGQLTIKGEYEQGPQGIIRTVINPRGGCGSLIIKDAAFLEGRLEVTAKEGTYEKGKKYDVVKSAGLIRGNIKLINKTGLTLALRILNDSIQVEVLKTQTIQHPF